MSVSYFKPTLDGTKTAWNAKSGGSMYVEVDDYPGNDGVATYMYRSGGQSGTYEFTVKVDQSTVEAAIPAGAIINSYQLWFSATSNNGTGKVKFYTFDGTNEDPQFEIALINQWVNYSYTYATTPSGGSWTRADIWGVEFGVQETLNPLFNYNLVTEIHIRVDWTDQTESTTRLAHTVSGDKIETDRMSHIVTGEIASSSRIANACAFQYDPTWWNNNYARRREILMGTDHSALPAGRTSSYNLFTGYEEVIATNSVVNEGIQHSSTQIFYHNGVTYVAWLAKDSGVSQYHIYIKKYTHATSTWSAAVDVTSSGSSSDTHYYPNLFVASDGYIHLFYGAHDRAMKYRKSTNAEDITAWGAQSTVGSSLTYPRMVEDDSGNLYLFARRKVSPDAWWVYYRSTNGGTTWDSTQNIVVDYSANYGGNASVYCGGVQYVGGRFHIVWTFWDWYGGVNKGRAISYAYSDDFTNWYNVTGTQIGTTDSDPILYADAELIFQSGNPWPSTGPFYHTNSQALIIDKQGKPCFLCQDWYGHIGERCNLWFARHNGTSWDKTNLSALSSAPKMWRYRTGAVLYADNTEIHIYAFVPPETSTDEYFGGEIYRWRTTDYGSTWSHDYLTGNSGYGIGMMSVLPQKIDGQFRELVYSRGPDICWREERTYSFVRPDGHDVRVVRQSQYNGVTVDTELDRVPDRFSGNESNIKFKLDKSVAANLTRRHAMESYWTYYNNYAATNPPRDPDNVFKWYEGFENYATGSDIAGQGGWTGTAGVCKAVADYDTATWASAHTNKLWSGETFCLINTGTAGAIEQSVSASDFELEWHHWLEGSGAFVYCEIYFSDAFPHYVRLGINGVNISYQRVQDSNPIDTGLNASTGQWSIFKFRVTSSGVSAWANGTQVLTDDAALTSIQKIKIGSTGSSNSVLDEFIMSDYVSNVEEVTLGTEEGTTNNAQQRFAHLIDPHHFAQQRFAHLTAGEKVSTQRIGELVAGEYAEVLRMASMVKIERAESIRLAAKIVGESEFTHRVSEQVSVEAAATKRIAEGLALEVAATLRLAHLSVVDATATDRLADTVDLDATASQRIAERLVLDAVLTQRVAMRADLDKSAVQRIAETLGVEASTVQRLANISVIEKGDVQRIANDIGIEFAQTVRIAAKIVGEQAVTQRVAQTIPAAATATLRLSEILSLDFSDIQRLAERLDVDKETVQRLAEDIALEADATDRLAQRIAAETATSQRLANKIGVDKEVVQRFAQDIQFQPETLERLAHRIAIEATAQQRLAQEADLDVAATMRLAGLVDVEVSAVKRLAENVGLAQEATQRFANRMALQIASTQRLAQLLGVEATVLTRLAHKVGFESSITHRQAHQIIFSVFLGLTFADISLSTILFDGHTLDTIQYASPSLATISYDSPELATISFADPQLTVIDTDGQQLQT